MYSTGMWGEKAKIRNKKRLQYFREYNKNRRNLDSQRQQNRNWIKKSKNNPKWVKKRTNYVYEYYKQKRKDALKVLGSCCVKCGFDDWRALQIDHINGGGTKAPKTGAGYLKNVIKSYENGENKYQLLCANCNFIKRYTNNEVKRRG